MSTDPYTEPEKPDNFGTAQSVLGVISSSLTGLIGAAFIVVGIGILIWGAFSAEPFLLPMGALVLLLGAARLLPLLLRRGR